MNNRRLYAAGLAVAAVGFVLDRTVFHDQEPGPQTAHAAAAPAARPAGKPSGTAQDPDKAAVAALVEKLKQLEASRSLKPSSVRDAFALESDAAPATGNPIASGSALTAEEFKTKHRLKTLVIPRDHAGLSAAILEGRAGVIRIGEMLDGYRLESVSQKKNNVGTATFVLGDVRVELIVPTTLEMPEAGPKEPPNQPPGS